MKDREMVIQGKSVKDARIMAKKFLQVDENQIQVEVLEEGRKGFLGLGARPVTVKVTLKSEKNKGLQVQTVDSDEEGMVEVRGGRLRVYGPVGRGKPAVIIPTPGVILRVNGVTVYGSRPVREDEEIEVESLEEGVQQAGVKVKISEDGYTARVQVTPQVTVRHELAEQNAQSVLQLLTKGHREEKKTVNAAEVEAALREQGVVFGLEHEEISRTAAVADGSWRIAAQGEPVRQGRDGFVEYLFDLTPVEITYGKDESINYWERYSFPSVKEGEVLAVLYPPVPGTPGKKVTGETVLPRPLKEASLKVKEGVSISEDGRKAVALRAGRPVLEGYREAYLKIVQLMVHPGDVDLKSGNLRYHGDLLILGNVSEGMKVAAHGNITVMGDIVGAVVQAGGRVVCRGKLIGTEVRAGGLKSFYNRIAPLLDELGEILEGITEETTRIKEHPQYKEKIDKKLLNGIVWFLMDKNKSRTEKLLTEYAAAITGVDLPFPPTIRAVVQDIKNLTNLQAKQDFSMPDELENILGKKQNITRLLEAIPDQPGDIICSYVQNSILDASGSIIVAEQGCYHSTLTAGKQVKVKGVFRGGEISARDNVSLDEAGSPGLSAGKVKIKVPEEAVVFFNRVYQETSVLIGNRSYIFEDDLSQVKVFLGNRGTVKMESFI
ncbi:MAG: flagellar assembly protein A [Bacillota bacterium]